MKSSNPNISLGFFLSVRKTRKALFLEQMDRVVPWSRLVDLIAPHCPAGRTGRLPFELETMLRSHFLQQWFNLSDPAMEEAFFDTPLCREFVGLFDNVLLPDKSTVLRFRRRLEKRGLATQMLAEVNTILLERGLMLKEGGAVDATLIAAPSSIKNKDKARDPEMHFSQKGNEHDITQAHRLLHGHEKTVWEGAGYQGVEKRPGADPAVTWHVAKRPGKRKGRNQAGEMGQLLEKAEKFKAGIRAKVAHPFRVIKRRFGYMKTRYRGLKKNAAQIDTLFALSNLWMVHRDLMGARA